VVREAGTLADPARDRITVDGQPLPSAEPRRYVLLHKPPGYLSARRDPGGRRVVTDLVPDGARLYPVGRLDADAEGLLLLTNDGALTHRLLGDWLDARFRGAREPAARAGVTVVRK